MSNSSILYPYSDDRWRNLGYYVTAALSVDTSNTPFTIGERTYTNYNSVSYFNARLEEDVEYSVIIRLFSAADDPVCYN